MEIWKDIENYESYYEVSNLGRIKSKRSCIIMKNILNNNGYLMCTLSAPGKRKKFSVHRLVAAAFIKNDLDKKQVNHIDGNKLNNIIINLEWVTPKENTNHAWRLGLAKVTDLHKEVARKTMTNTMSKKVVDLQTGIFYDSLTKAAAAINSNYNTEKTRIRKNNTTLRFKYI
jgi:hypothetical protein